MKAFLHEMTAVLQAVWHLMKTANIYAGAIPDATLTECREYRTAKQWQSRDH